MNCLVDRSIHDMEPKLETLVSQTFNNAYSPVDNHTKHGTKNSAPLYLL